MRPRIIFLLLFGILGFLLLLSCCTGIFTPILEPAAGDWGDAPDPDQGMDTGYYAPVTGTGFGFIVYGNAGVPAQFPTDHVGVQGPYASDVDDFWIGPMFPFGPVDMANVPSIELGVYDLSDPDGLSNLWALPPSTTPIKADCDKENGSHDPLPACNPVPPYYIQMNGFLVIMIGNPPLALYISNIWFSPNAAVEEGVYWNVLFDTNQDGAWSGDEWVERDQLVVWPPGGGPPPSGGGSVLVITDVFEWGYTGKPFGRLLFPVWARSMVTAESVANAVGAGPYDGRGPSGGFSAGEIEDYFVEWRPIGQMLPGTDNAGPIPPKGSRGDTPWVDPEREGLEKLLPRFLGPEKATVGEQIVLEPAGPSLSGIKLICITKNSGAVLRMADLPSNGKENSVCAGNQMSVIASWADGKVNINVETAPDGSRLLLVGSTGEKTGLGTKNVPIHGGKIVTIINRG